MEKRREKTEFMFWKEKAEEEVNGKMNGMTRRIYITNKLEQ